MRPQQPQIAIIDDGVNEGLYGIEKLNHNIEITPKLEFMSRHGYNMYLPSHGTTCAAIIKKYAPSAVLSSIRILNYNHKSTSMQLGKSLEWCVHNKIRLLNLSLGTVNYKEYSTIKKYVDYAFENDTIIVAASNNRNIFTCPASFENVIGVKGDHLGVFQNGGYFCRECALDGIDVVASATHTLNRNEITLPSNSYAAPYITAMIYNILTKQPTMSFQQIKSYLSKMSQFTKYDSRFNEIYRSNNIDVPIIAIYDYTNGSGVNLAKYLCRFMRADGYNAISTVDKRIENDNYMEALHLENFLNDSFNSVNTIFSTIYNIFDPEAFIVCLNCKSGDTAFRNQLESFHEIDILIIVENEYSNRIDTSIIDSSIDKETKLFYLYKTSKIADHSKTEFKYMKYEDINLENYANILYNNIIDSLI